MQCPDQTHLALLLLEHLSDTCARHFFEAGDVIFEEGDLSDSMYVLVLGRLKVYSTEASGREVVHNTLHSGSVFGETFLDFGPCSTSVKATEPSECLRIDRPQLNALMRTHPHISECLILHVIARLRHATGKVRALAFDGVYERVTTVLDEAAVEDEFGRHIPRHFTQAEIASHVGASREMVNHILRDLIQGGFILRDRQHQMTLVRPLPKHW